jgi:hypothetical protein
MHLVLKIKNSVILFVGDKGANGDSNVYVYPLMYSYGRVSCKYFFDDDDDTPTPGN